MEATRIVRRPFIRITGTGPKTAVNNVHVGVGDFRVSMTPRNCYMAMRHQFSDSTHVQYYTSTRCGTEKKEKENSLEIKRGKKKLKLIKRLSKNLSKISDLGYGQMVGDSLVGGVQEKMILEAAEIIIAQLKNMKIEQRKLKRKMEANSKESSDSSSSSSSSSESSDSEGGEVMDMKQLRINSLKRSEDLENQKDKEASPSSKQHSISPIEEENLSGWCKRTVGNCCNSNGLCSDDKHVIAEKRVGSCGDDVKQRIEICMGSKCKKLGADLLLQEFKRKVGVEGVVVGCKCMGKCRDGPNVRVGGGIEGTKKEVYVNNPLCIGVGLDDVDAILANLQVKNIDHTSPVASS